MHTLLSIAFASAAGSLIACSAYDGSGLPAANPADPTFNDGEGGVLKNIGKGGDGGVSNQCATASATPTPLPVSLVFMFDKSGSMSENAKWPSCQQGLSAFFGDPSSVGLSASIQFFPQNSNQCSSSIYQTPTVAMHTLPDAADFNNAMKANSPGGETPTLPAMTGAIAYAQQIQKQQSIGKVAVVLVTDGQPNVCGSTMQAVSVEAKTGFSAGIPTFVIGVGNTGNLNAIAAAGGTTQATIINTNNASQTAQDFQTALNAIRGMTLGCDYAIPALPNGATLDQVNVVFTPNGGSPVTLSYDAACTNPAGGWHYDGPTTPNKIVLCKTSCDAVTKSKSGKIDLVFGCATKGGIPR